jgi:hypothetical protein
MTILVKLHLLLMVCVSGTFIGIGFKAHFYWDVGLGFLLLAISNVVYEGMLSMHTMLFNPLGTDNVDFPTDHYVETTFFQSFAILASRHTENVPSIVKAEFLQNCEWKYHPVSSDFCSSFVCFVCLFCSGRFHVHAICVLVNTRTSAYFTHPFAALYRLHSRRSRPSSYRRALHRRCAVHPHFLGACSRMGRCRMSAFFAAPTTSRLCPTALIPRAARARFTRPRNSQAKSLKWRTCGRDNRREKWVEIPRGRASSESG